MPFCLNPCLHLLIQDQNAPIVPNLLLLLQRLVYCSKDSSTAQKTPLLFQRLPYCFKDWRMRRMVTCEFGEFLEGPLPLEVVPVPGPHVGRGVEAEEGLSLVLRLVEGLVGEPAEAV